VHRLLRLIAPAALTALSTCAADTAVTATNGPPPAVYYPQLLLAAGVQGPVRFRVRLDSVGTPQLSTLELVSTPNPGFLSAIRRGLQGWRDAALADHIFEHTVRFVMMDVAATDSVALCRSSADEWLVCARRVPPRVISVPAPMRSEP
jgi:hypothetical protein